MHPVWMQRTKLPCPWPERAVRMAGYIAQLAQHQRGDFAALRRMDPDEPDAAAFWRLMAHHDLAEQ